MSEYTTNLSLFKYNLTNETDLNTPFNIGDALNTNWDTLDNYIYQGLNEKVSINSLVNADAIVYAVNSHTGGIILFSNNYCIQFGKVERTAASQTVTLARSYKDSNYAKFIQAYHLTASTDGRPPLIHEPSASGTTINSFIVNIYTGYTGFYWKTEGFLS